MKLTSAGTEPAVQDHHLRRLLRRQAATVTVITAVDANRPVGFTATTFTPVSLRPPLVSFCLHRRSSCAPAVATASHVAVHLLRAGQVEVAERFATSGIDRFTRTAWRPGPYGVPLLEGTLAWLACQVLDRVPAGDHVLVLAEPAVAEYAADGVPLIYHDGHYGRPHAGASAR